MYEVVSSASYVHHNATQGAIIIYLSNIYPIYASSI